MYNCFNVPLFEGDIGKLTKAKLAQYENSRTFAMVFYRLVNMALDYRYTFTDLPDTMDDRVLKQSLLFYGSVVLFRINGVPIGLSGVQDGSALDLYGNAKSAYVFSRNGILNKNVKLNYKYDTELINSYNLGISVDKDVMDKEVTDGVILYENKSRTPFIWTVIYFAERIADTYRTLDSNRRWLKRPFIPRCEESESKSFDESLKKFMNNEDFTISLHAHNIDKTDIFSVDVPAGLTSCVTQLAEWYESQFKILCGIKANSQVDKKGENLISDEINIDDEYSTLNTNSVIEELNRSLEVYNNLTGLNIQADVTETEQEQEEKEEEQQEAFAEQEENDGKSKDVSRDN